MLLGVGRWSAIPAPPGIREFDGNPNVYDVTQGRQGGGEIGGSPNRAAGGQLPPTGHRYQLHLGGRIDP
jgi:hypothetical protein